MLGRLPSQQAAGSNNVRIQPHQEQRNEACPSGLMACSTAATCVAVEVFVEGDVIVPVGIRLKKITIAEDRSAPISVAPEQVSQAACNFVGHFGQVHKSA